MLRAVLVPQWMRASATRSLVNSTSVLAHTDWSIRSKTTSARALRRQQLKQQKKQVKNVPKLKDTLRKIYLRTHPDLFGQFPMQQEQNAASYKELMGILNAIEKEQTFPPAQTLELPFYLKTPMDGQFQHVVLRMRTTGGACNSLVEEALGRFFTECGLPSVFDWSVGSWGKAVGKDAVRNVNMEFEDATKGNERQHRAEAAAEAEMAQESDDEEEQTQETIVMPAPEIQPNAVVESSVETVLRDFNDELEIIAAVPWMDEDGSEEYMQLRRFYKGGPGLDVFEERGFAIKRPTELIWEGERDISVLTKGLDTDSALVVQRILMHAENIAREIKEQLAAQAGIGGASDNETDDDAASAPTS